MPISITTIDGHTSDGLPARVIIDLTVPDAPAPVEPEPVEQPTPVMVVGATVHEVEFAQLASGRVQGAAFCRTFSPPGGGITPWTSSRRTLPAGVADFHSFKDWKSDDDAVGAVTALLDAMPARLLEDPPLLPSLRPYDPDGYSDGQPESDGFSFLLTWNHEGEPNCIAAGIPVREWRRRHRLVYKTVRQHRNGRRVGYMPIQTGTWTEAKTTPAKGPKGDFDALAWWAGVGDYCGYDAYLFSITDKPAGPALYKPARDFLTIPLQLAAATGRRLFLAELGVITQGSPADSGEHRAAWIRATVAEARARGVAGVAWWDALGTNSRDFRLLDGPSQAAWQDAIFGR